MPELACSWARRRRSSLRMLRDATTTILTSSEWELVCERSSNRLKLAKLAGREPKRAASLCPTVLLKIGGHGAPDKPAAVIPAIDRNEPPRIKVDSALRKRGHRRRRALRRQRCQLLRIVKQAQARAAPAEPSVDQGDRQPLRGLRERLQARAVPIIDGAAAYEVLRQVAFPQVLAALQDQSAHRVRTPRCPANPS